jgi:transposase
VQQVRLRLHGADGDQAAAADREKYGGRELLAQVIVAKCADHLPLHRQEKIFERHGVAISRKSMCGWMAQSADLLIPLYAAAKEVLFGSKVIGTDDTSVKVLDRKLPFARTGRIWPYYGDSEHPVILYDYTPTRERAGPEKFLAGYRGYLQADAYGGYDAFFKDPTRGLIEVACWAHSRRYFHKALESDQARMGPALLLIAQLYRVEKQTRLLAAEDRLRLRQLQARPILDKLHLYLLEIQAEVLPKSPQGRAVRYALKNWQALTRYSENGILEIDNTATERSIRGVAVGRGNWMFFGSDVGGRTAAVLRSFVASCQRVKVDPFAWFKRHSHPHPQPFHHRHHRASATQLGFRPSVAPRSIYRPPTASAQGDSQPLTMATGNRAYLRSAPMAFSIPACVFSELLAYADNLADRFRILHEPEKVIGRVGPRN